MIYGPPDRAPAIVGLEKEVWICRRTDGVSGSGSMANPYNVFDQSDDGAAEMLDAILRPIYLTSTEKVSVYLGRGSFPCFGNGDMLPNAEGVDQDGSYGFQMPSYFKIKGLGMGKTELKKMGINTRSYLIDGDDGPIERAQATTMLYSQYYSDCYGLHIEGLTIDMNKAGLMPSINAWRNSPPPEIDSRNFGMSATMLKTRGRTVVRDVEIKNGYTDTVDMGWGIFLVHWGAPSYGNIVDNLWAHSCSGAFNLVGVGSNREHDPDAEIQARVTNCVLDNSVDTLPNSQCLNTGGAVDSIFEKIRMVGGDSGIFRDTGPNLNGNTFRDISIQGCGKPIYHAGGWIDGYRNEVFENIDIYLLDNHNGAVIYLGGAVHNNIFRDIRIHAILDEAGEFNPVYCPWLRVFGVASSGAGTLYPHNNQFESITIMHPNIQGAVIDADVPGSPISVFDVRKDGGELFLDGIERYLV